MSKNTLKLNHRRYKILTFTPIYVLLLIIQIGIYQSKNFYRLIKKWGCMKLKILLALLLLSSSLLGMEEKPNLKRKRTEIRKQSSVDEDPSTSKKTKKEKKSLKRKFDNAENNADNQEQPAMKKSHLEEKLLEELGLSNEIWAIVLEHLYFDPSILDEAKDIYEGIDIVRKHIEKCIKTIPFVCKIFKDLSISREHWALLKEKIREFYIPHLNARFLELQEGKDGLYPKGGQWLQDINSNIQLGLFIEKGIVTFDLFFHSNIKEESKLDKDHKLIYLLLFYLSNPDIKDLHGWTLLHSYLGSEDIDIVKLLLKHKANPNLPNGLQILPLNDLFRRNLQQHLVRKNAKILLKHGANPNILDIEGIPPLSHVVDVHIKASIENSQNKNYNPKKDFRFLIFLLKYGANPNIKGFKGTPLQYFFWTAESIKRHNYSIGLDIIIPLLEYGANPYITNEEGKNVFDIAKANHFNEFPALVRKCAQNTLVKICILQILNNLSLYEDKLDILPEELRNKINSLRSN